MSKNTSEVRVNISGSDRAIIDRLKQEETLLSDADALLYALHYWERSRTPRSDGASLADRYREILGIKPQPRPEIKIGRVIKDLSSRRGPGRTGGGFGSIGGI